MSILNNAMDVIRCDEDEFIIWKWHSQGGDKSGQRANSVRWGSSVRVKPGQAAAFYFRSGIDYIDGPFDDFLKTENLPVITGLLEKVYGGGSPFQAEIYFINAAQVINLPFGAPYFDVHDSRHRDYPVPLAVRGSIDFNISDYKAFVDKHELKEYSKADIQTMIRSAMGKYIQDAVRKALLNVGCELDAISDYQLEINEQIEEQLKAILFERYKVNVLALDIVAIDIDRESKEYKKYSSITQNKAASLLHGAQDALGGIALHRAGAKKIKENVVGSFNIHDAAQKVSNVFKKNTPAQSSDGFFVAVNGKQTGPFDTDKLLKMAKKGTLTRSSLVWKEGMEAWVKASEAEDLAAVIATIPPELNIPQ